MGMIDIIKQASIGAVGAGNPVEITLGEVVSIDKFEVKIEQKLILPKEFFIVPESLTRYEIDLTHSHSTHEGSTSNSLNKVVIREGLKQGDKLLLLRVQGGQKYVILDKVV
jgi:hypothetical protein